MPDATPSKRWLFGPWLDLSLGCGLGYVVLLFWLAMPGAVSSLHPAVTALLVVAISSPHYGATLLRVYEQRDTRRRYAIFAVWMTIALAALVTLGAFYVSVATVLYTIYITWSPWHYSGQNYGIAVMFLRRRGIPLTDGAKRLLHLSFVSSFAVAFLAMHTEMQSLAYDPNAETYEGVAGAPLGIPYSASRILYVATLAIYLGSLIGAAVLLRRGASWRDLAPTGALVLSQALWFALPFSVSFLGTPTGIAPFDHVSRFALWTAYAHAAQYLWITSYYARHEPGWRSAPRYYAKAVAAGVAVWALPVVVFAPDLTGGLEYSGGLALLVAAGVNIHHFILDGAIWKLRHSPIARVLIRSDDVAGPAPIEPATGPRWLRGAVWAVCSLMVAFKLGGIWFERSGFVGRLRAGDLASAERGLDLQAWVGRDSSRRRLQLARQWVGVGAPDRAAMQYRRSLELRQTDAAWVGLAVVSSEAGEWEEVIDTFERAVDAGSRSMDLAVVAARAFYESGDPDAGRALLDDVGARSKESSSRLAQLGRLAYELGDAAASVAFYRESLKLDPSRDSAANDLAWVLATSDAPTRDPKEAVRWARHALEGAEANPNFLETLAVAHAAAGQGAEALAVAERALGLAQEQGKEELARQLETRIGALRSP